MICPRTLSTMKTDCQTQHKHTGTRRTHKGDYLVDNEESAALELQPIALLERLHNTRGVESVTRTREAMNTVHCVLCAVCCVLYAVCCMLCAVLCADTTQPTFMADSPMQLILLFNVGLMTVVQSTSGPPAF